MPESEKSPAQSPVEVVHRLERRVHLRAPVLAHHREACQRIADRLAAQFEGHRIAVRPHTGSIIVEREAGNVDHAALAEKLAALLAEELDEEGRPLLGPRGEKGKPSHLARALVTAFRGLNDDVRDALEGRADLAALAPVILAASSAVQVARSGEIRSVPWFNLLWYSTRAFLSFNAEAVVDKVDAVTEQRVVQ